jgi:hypothetical protein
MNTYVLWHRYILYDTDRFLLQYGIGKYQEILTNTDQKIPIQYLTLYKTAWRKVVADNLPTPTASDESNEDPKKGFKIDDNGFRRAVKLFVCKILDNKTPRDLQYVYMALGGNYCIEKDLLMPPRKHAILLVAEQLSPGKTPKPSKKLALQWYYMTYHCADRTEYVKSGKKLSAETIKSLTNYFQALFFTKKARWHPRARQDGLAAQLH